MIKYGALIPHNFIIGVQQPDNGAARKDANCGSTAIDNLQNLLVSVFASIEQLLMFTTTCKCFVGIIGRRGSYLLFFIFLAFHVFLVLDVLLQ